MKSLRLLVVFLLLPAGLLATAPVPPRILLISIDGLMPDSYTRPGPLKIPHLRALADAGAWASGVEGVVPTVTYPSHTSIITGVTPAVHGIVDNRILDPENRSSGAWFWYAESIQAPTLPGAARARGLTAGAVSWPVTIGMDLDFNVPEFWRSSHRETLSLIKALSHPPRVLDHLENARGMPLDWPQTDRSRTDIATYLIRTYRPHVLLVHLLELDSALHSAGPGSPRAAETAERLDAYVGEILQALDEAGVRQDTCVAVVSDHGFRALATQLQPNALLKREGLLTTDDAGTITDWQAYYHASGGSGYVYLKNRDDAALVERVGKLLQALSDDPGNGIEALWTAGDLERLGAHPGASFGIAMAEGFYSSGGHDTLLKPTTSRGGHGFAPWNPEMHASLILSGAGVSTDGDLGIVRMTQIAPTLAHMLGVGLSPLADQPLWEVADVSR